MSSKNLYGEKIPERREMCLNKACHLRYILVQKPLTTKDKEKLKLLKQSLRKIAEVFENECKNIHLTSLWGDPAMRSIICTRLRMISKELRTEAYNLKTK
jgi:hypothetical protein